MESHYIASFHNVKDHELLHKFHPSSIIEEQTCLMKGISKISMELSDKLIAVIISIKRK